MITILLTNRIEHNVDRSEYIYAQTAQTPVSAAYDIVTEDDGTYVIDLSQINIDVDSVEGRQLLLQEDCIDMFVHKTTTNGLADIDISIDVHSGYKVRLIGTLHVSGSCRRVVFQIDNEGDITDFDCSVSGCTSIGLYNYGTISGGTYDSNVNVVNKSGGIIAGGNFKDCDIDNEGTIKGGTFSVSVFFNWQSGEISGGSFSVEKFLNYNQITGGDFRGVSEIQWWNGSVTGGIFNEGANIPKESSCIYWNEGTKTYTVQGNVTLHEPLEIGDGETLVIEKNAKLIDPNGLLEVADGGIINDLSGYIDINYYDPLNKCTLTQTEAREIDGTFTELTDGWYVVNGNIHLSDRIKISGNVNIILVDGACLDCSNGINVCGDDSLTIWGQSADYESNGKLIARGGADQAGIGGNKGESSGLITINGGYISSEGGQNDGAGIGGGDHGDGTVVINGGIVISQGAMLAAGLGGGLAGKGSVTITGGMVAARGGLGSGSGIGGGCDGSGEVRISGGNVIAEGHDKAAGIGGGQGCKGNVEITGGEVRAYGGSYGYDIGDGINSDKSDISDKGSFSTGKNGNPVIHGSVSDVSGREEWHGIVDNTVYGDVVLENDYTVESGETLVIPDGSKLTVSEHVTLTNKGNVQNSGTLDNKGTVKNQGAIENTESGTMTNHNEFTNDGTITNSGSFENAENSTFTNNHVMTNSGDVTNSGSMTNNGEIKNTAESKFENKATGILENNKDFVNEPGAEYQNRGTVKQKSYTVTFVCDDQVISEQTIHYGEMAELPEIDEKAGFWLDGWYTDKEFANKWDFENYTIDGNLTLYARWIENGKISCEADDDNILEASLSMTPEELSEAVLDDEERRLLAEGENIQIILDIEDGSVSEQEAQLINNSISDYNIYRYYDIEISKVIGSSTKNIHETNKPVCITIALPDEISKIPNRKFILYRLHDGEIEALGDMDSNEKTYTFESDRFSIYILTYKDWIYKWDGGSDTSSGNDTPAVNPDHNAADTSSGEDDVASKVSISPNTGIAEDAVSGEGSISPNTGIAEDAASDAGSVSSNAEIADDIVSDADDVPANAEINENAGKITTVILLIFIGILIAAAICLIVLFSIRHKKQK